MAGSDLKWQRVLLLLLMVPGALQGAEDATVAVGRFSQMSPGARVTDWEPMTFEKIASHTRYALVSDNGRTVLQAVSQASASGLVRTMGIDPNEFPVLTWDWKISNTIVNGDVTRKSGDDYAARIYITFSEDPERLSFFQRAGRSAIQLLYGKTPPSAALAYVWGNRAPVGTVHPNPYTDRVQMIVVESGPARANQWRSARRDIVDDFRRAFGNDPPPITGIAVMTDTDNTGEAATAWFGDIVFSPGIRK